MGPPADFVDLFTAQNAPAYSFVNVMGIVVDLMPATQPKGDWMLTFKLLDTRLRDSISGSQGLKVRFFKRDFEHLPRVQNLGDIVLLRDIKVMPVFQEKMLVSNYQTSTVVFPGASIPDLNFQVAYEGTQRLECLGAPQDKARVTLEEQSYVFALKNELQDTVDALSDTNVSGMPANGFPVDTDEPAAKRPRLNEPSLQPRRPPNAPAGPTAPQSRRSDILQQRPPTNAPSGPAALQSRRSDVQPQPQQAGPSRQSSFGSKHQLVRELVHYRYADICAEVVKKYPSPFGGCELYVTDYTPNKDMWYYTPPEEDQDVARDGDMFGYAGGPPKRQFPGPYGWLVLKVNVKDPHASFVNDKVKEGDFVLLRNVKMKTMSDGAKLEGDMWPDMQNPAQVKASKLLNYALPEIEAICERKEKYWAGRHSKTNNQENAKLSRSEKKRKKKKQKAEKKAAEAGALDSLLKDQSKADINPHVRCSNDEVPITAVKDILDSENERHTTTPPHSGGESYVIPFINAKYRARVHVVDYEPKALEDFAVPAEAEEDEEDEDAMSLDGRFFASNSNSNNSQKWNWSFRLLLEDASTGPAQSGTEISSRRIWTTFDHESAQYLFGNSMEDPADLRADSTLLAKLRERLYILWGNLAETKAGAGVAEGGGEGLSNRAFECCIMEYGVPVQAEGGVDDGGQGTEGGVLGFERCFAGFGVTIT